jgi:hypothetical protein
MSGSTYDDEIITSHSRLLLEIEDLKNEIGISKQKIEDLNEQLRYAEEVNNELARESELKSQQIANQISLNNNFQQTIEHIQVENEELKRTIDKHREDRSRRETELNLAAQILQVKLRSVETESLKQADIYKQELRQLKEENQDLRNSVQKLIKDLDEEKSLNQRQLEKMFDYDLVLTDKTNNRFSFDFECSNKFKEINMKRLGVIETSESCLDDNNNRRESSSSLNDKNFFLERFKLELFATKNEDLNAFENRSLHVKELINTLEIIKEEYEKLKNQDCQHNSIFMNRSVRSLFDVVMIVLFGLDSSRNRFCLSEFLKALAHESSQSKKPVVCLRKRFKFYRHFYRSSINKVTKLQTKSQLGKCKHRTDSKSKFIKSKNFQLVKFSQFFNKFLPRELILVIKLCILFIIICFLAFQAKTFSRVILMAENSIGVKNPFETMRPY